MLYILLLLCTFRKPNNKLPKGSEHVGEIDGVQVKFLSIDEEKMSIGFGSEPAIDKSYEGPFTIPSNIIIGDTTYDITEINDNAFYETKITTITIDADINKIGQSAFEKSFIVEITFTRSTFSELPLNCFKDCVKLTTASLPSISIVGENAFLNCPITTFNFDTISIIHSYAFSNTDIEHVEIKSTQIDTLPDHAFYESNLKTIILPDSVTFIGSFCFSYSSITKFVGTAALEQISDNAFKSCQSLDIVDLSLSTKLATIEESTFEESTCHDVTLPSSLEFIKIKAFYGCSKLEKLDFPANLQEISESAFEGCTYLTIVDLAHTMCSVIGNKAFSGCMDLISVTFSEKLTSVGIEAFFYTGIDIAKMSSCDTIGISVFKGCTSLHSVDLEETSIQIIPNEAFNGANSLITVRLPSTITEIQPNSFLDCIELSEINFPDNLKTIGEQAFMDCSSLSMIDLEGTAIDYFSFKVFYRCSSLTQIKWPAKPEAIYLNESCFEETGFIDLIFPSNLNYFSFCCFKLCSDLVSVDLTQVSATEIRGEAFNDCVNLVTVKLSDNIKKIWAYAFSNVGLTTFKNSNLDKLASQVFYNAKKLEVVDLRGCTIVDIGLETFYSCTNLREIYLDNTQVKEIKSKAFRLCTSLSKITFPECLNSLYDSSFESCTALESIDFRNTALTELRAKALKGCSSLKEIKWSKSIRKIMFNVIDGCSSFGTIVVPASVTELGDEAFVNSGIQVADLREYTMNLGYKLFYNCQRLETVLFPKTPYQIGQTCFQLCTGMKSIVVNEYCTALANGCMRGMYELEYADLGQTQVTELPQSLFDGNSKLDTLVLPTVLEKFSTTGMFYNCPLADVYYAGSNTFEGVKFPFSDDTEVHVLENFTGETFCGRNVSKDYVPLPPPEEESTSSLEDEFSSSLVEDSSSSLVDEETSSLVEDSISSLMEDITSSLAGEETSSLPEEIESSESAEKTSSGNDIEGGDKEEEDEEDEDEAEEGSIGAIVGGAVGGTVLFIGVIVAACFLMRYKKLFVPKDNMSEMVSRNDQSTTWILSDTQINLVDPSSRTLWNDYLENKDFDDEGDVFAEIDVEA